MKRLLLIAYYFPPDGGGGVQRPVKFCRYLADFGWQPIVLTRDTRDASAWQLDADASLAAEIGASTRVHRVGVEPARDWARTLPTIDIARDWLEPALREAHRLVREQSIDAVMITMSPFDLCFVGQRLQAAFDIPVIYDLRDPWALDGWRLHGTRRRWRQDHAAMTQTLSNARGVIANTPESARALRQVIPDLDETRLATITNGYDAADFVEPCKPPFEPDAVLFRLVHTGTFVSRELYRYDGLLGKIKRWRHHRPRRIDVSGRTPHHLLRAIHRLRRAHPSLGRRLRLVCVGQLDPWTQRCVDASGLQDVVSCTGYQPHAQSIAWVRHADALFLPLGGLPAGERSLIVPGKTYEYLAARRPILAALPAGDARDMVARSGLGFCADPCDEAALARALVTMAETREAGALDKTAAMPAWLSEYERRALTQRLAAFLDRLTGTSSAAREASAVPAGGGA
ncbi:MAG: glycosyltransferase [Phycisphaeraceae bacterium]